jgi:hypothetical protein
MVPQGTLNHRNRTSNAGGDKVPRKLPIGGASSDGGCRRWGDPTGHYGREGGLHARMEERRPSMGRLKSGMGMGVDASGELVDR